MQRPALILGERTISFEDLEDRASRVQTVIEQAAPTGAAPVAVMLPNGIEFFEVTIAAARAARHVVPVNWHLKAEELAWVLGDSGAEVLFVDTSLAGEVAPALAANPAITTFEVGARSYEEEVARAAPAEGTSAPPHFVYYTSGTTGRPRGVEREGPAPDTRRLHGGLASMWGITADDVWLACSPLYHAANAYAFTTLFQGGTVVILERFDAREWIRQVERHRVTACFMVPAHFIRLLELPSEEWSAKDLSSLRLVLHAAAPCPVPVKWRILDALAGVEIWEFYGASEGGATRISPEEWRTHPGSVGKPWPGVEIAILDAGGRRCGPGEAGLVHIHPAGGAKFRYHNDPGKTEAAWREGAFTVGDVGYVDEEGYLYLTDRASDMVIRG
ncbi:MAG: AMP-binding protein, partial [Acidimicrobiales bacterium]